MITFNEHIDKIREACRINQVKRLFAFGSATRYELKEHSDIDLVVEIQDLDPLAYSDHYFDLKEKLEKLFNRPIDLLEAKAIRNPFLKAEIDRTKVLIYGK
jgi:predicted nucleotidyltransferase